MRKQRPEFKSWENLVKTQIAASESAVVALNLELSATRGLLKAQRRILKMARRDEARTAK